MVTSLLLCDMKNLGRSSEYWEGIQEGMKHTEPSPETIKRIESIEGKIELLATKQDIKEMKEAFEDFTNAITFLKRSGKISYRALLIIATIVVSVVAIGGGFKTILNWFLK